MLGDKLADMTSITLRHRPLIYIYCKLLCRKIFEIQFSLYFSNKFIMVSNQVLLCSIVFKFVAMFIGVCGNIAVIILTRTSKFWSKEKTNTSYLVGNLALADLLMCLTLYPTWIVEFILTIYGIESDQALFCKFNRSFAFSLLFSSVASLLAITVDRYIYIVKPLK